MVSRKLPSLNALRAFEVAARHLNFTKASEELFVTQAAVSQQVKTLEDQMGLQLFRRAGRRVLLTPEGQNLLDALTRIFDDLADSCRAVQANTGQGPLVISTTDSFATSWLMVRLGAFSERYPEISVRIVTQDRLVDFSRDDVGLAIRHGPGDYPGLEVVPLMPDAVFPVCSPAFLDGPRPLKTPADLKHHALISGDIPKNWERWLEAAGQDPTAFNMGLVTNHSHLMYQAARDGQGVAIGRAVMVADDIAAGRLVRPFELSVPSPAGYYIVTSKGGLDHPKSRCFVDWLIEIVRKEQKDGHVPDWPKD